MLACHNMRVRYIDTILKVEVIQLQHKSNRLRSIHSVEVIDCFLWDRVQVSKLLREAARRKQYNSSHVQSGRACTSRPGQML